MTSGNENGHQFHSLSRQSIMITEAMKRKQRLMTSE